MGRTTSSMLYELKDLDTSSLQEPSLTRLAKQCKVAAGYEVEQWEGQLTPSQCKALKPSRFLGQGAFASAYEQAGDSERVVKFTADKLDAETSAELVGRDLQHAVKVFEVVKLKGQTASALVMKKTGKFEFDRKPRQPVFGIVTERLGKLSKVQSAAASAYNDVSQQRGADGLSRRERARKADPTTFRAEEFVKPEVVEMECVRYTHDRSNKAACKVAVAEVFEAVNELARKTGVIPVDLHSGNWGIKPKSGKLAILDLGVSAGSAKPPKIRLLAGAVGKRKKR